MNRLLAILLLFICCYNTGSAQSVKTPFPLVPATQENISGCVFDFLMKEQRNKPLFKAAEEAMNRAIGNYRRQYDTSIVTLPVVFHIVRNNPSSVTDAAINIALQELNDAFSKAGVYSSSTGVDTRIRFCLAKTDPDGGITSGITRTTHFFGSNLNPVIEDAKLKNLMLWDPSRFINIWAIESMQMETVPKFQCGRWVRVKVGGYATLPPGGGPTDGIVVTGFGNLLVHEMGHYLGLYHTFEGLNCRNFDCTIDGDRVCDTPPDVSLSNSPSCTLPDNSCGTDTLSGFTTDQKDLIANFMDYGNNACHNNFTEGQTERMRAAISTQRPGLLVNKCSPPCTENIVASFTRNNFFPLPGATITFTNTSTGATRYAWLVNGVVIDTTPNFTYTFPAIGKYKVTLEAFNTLACVGIQTDYVVVNCGVTARFYTDKQELASKAGFYLDSVRFTNNSENGTSFTWLMSSNQGMLQQVVSTATNFTYVFQSPATYYVQLIATNGVCTDTSNVFPITVIDPTPDAALYIYSVECYQETKVRLTFYICNNGFTPIPKGLPVSFYDANPRVAGAIKIGSTSLPDTILGNCCGYLITRIFDVGRRGLNQVWGVVADSGNAVPVLLPNTPLIEKDYNNNFSVFSGFAFKVTATPALSVLEWGDTIQLNAQARPGSVASYVWSTAAQLSCTTCQSPRLIADTGIIKTVIATSSLGCTDTARITIQVPPYNDFSVTIDEVECARQDSLFVKFTILNAFKRAVIPKGLTVSFYSGDPQTATATLLPKMFTVPDTIKAKQATFTTVIKGMPTGTLYAAVNDSGKVVPVTFPNTPFLEKLYSNNIGQYNYVRFSIAATPASSILEWGDTIQLTANSTAGAVGTYQWSTPRDISCTTCQSPEFIADSSIIKKVIATSRLGCIDSSFVVVNVPPYNDFSIKLNDVQCARGDSLYINFSLFNSFKRAVLPKTLSVTFYNGDPRTGAAVLLGPVFALADTIRAKQATFFTRVKGFPAGRLFAVVNDSGRSVPIVLPTTRLLEKAYDNNIVDTLYAPEKVIVAPADSTVFRTNIVPLVMLTPVYNAASTLWSNGSGYTLSCTNCPATVATVYNNVLVPVQTENRYGCIIKGAANLKVFPPDMQVKMIDTKCFTNNTAQVTFRVCMNNLYDSVFANIPVSFYDGDPTNGGSKLLSPVFLTPAKVYGGCTTYTTRITSPLTGRIVVVVNDKGDNRSVIPSKAYDETDYTNNTDTASYTPFAISIFPSDTAIQRLTNIRLIPSAVGGTITSYSWTPPQFISCTNCATPTVTPPYTFQYQLFSRNEFSCTDTAMAIIRTHTAGQIFIPDAFTPNGDHLNDVLYVMTGSDGVMVEQFSIFNRWGEPVFNSQNVPPNNPIYGWKGNYSGQPAPPGTYVYFVTVRFDNDQQKTLKGTVVLIR